MARNNRGCSSATDGKNWRNNSSVMWLELPVTGGHAERVADHRAGVYAYQLDNIEAVAAAGEQLREDRPDAIAQALGGTRRERPSDQAPHPVVLLTVEADDVARQPFIHRTGRDAVFPQRQRPGCHEPPVA